MSKERRAVGVGERRGLKFTLGCLGCGRIVDGLHLDARGESHTYDSGRGSEWCGPVHSFLLPDSAVPDTESEHE